MYDTVERVDTAWKVKLVTKTHWDTIYTERVVIAKPETVYINSTYSGVTQITVPKTIGDSTKILGLTVSKIDSTFLLRRWQVNYFTPGPLAALSADTFPPRVKFYEAVKGCNVGCSLKKVGIGVLIGFGAGKL